MTKYVIKTDSFEFRFGTYKNSIPYMNAEEVFNSYLRESCNDPVIRESFDTLDEAWEVFEKNYSFYGSTHAEKGNVFWLLRGDVAWLEEEEYDEDGEFDQSNGIYKFSAESYYDEE